MYVLYDRKRYDMPSLRTLVSVTSVFFVIAEFVVRRHFGTDGQASVQVYASAILERIKGNTPSPGETEVITVALFAFPS